MAYTCLSFCIQFLIKLEKLSVIIYIVHVISVNFVYLYIIPTFLSANAMRVIHKNTYYLEYPNEFNTWLIKLRLKSRLHIRRENYTIKLKNRKKAKFQNHYNYKCSVHCIFKNRFCQVFFFFLRKETSMLPVLRLCIT